MFPFAFIFLAIAAVIIFAVIGAQQEKKRVEQLRQWAQSQGLAFSKARDPDMRHRFPNFKCLDSGSDRYAYNIIRGRWDDRDLLLYDYHYETTSTDSKGRRKTHHHYMTVVILQPAYALKPLVIRSEGLFDKLSGFFGYDDIDFESAEFSREFHVQSPDRRWAYDVLHNRAIQHLLAAPRRTIEFDASHAMTWVNGRASVTSYQSMLHTLGGLLDQMPPYVIKQQAQAASQ